MTNQVVLITGALTGIGRATAVAFANKGAKVVVSGRHDDKGQDLVTELRALGAEAEFFCADVQHEDEVRDLVDKTVARFGRLDVAVNNAGVEGETGVIQNATVENFRAVHDTNVLGVFLSMKHELRAMERQDSGSIVNIASTYGVVAPDPSLYDRADGTRTFYKSPAYPAGKGAVLAFTRFLAAYWGGAGVRVNSLSPGGVENGQEAEFIARYSARTPLGRMAQPGDYAGALLFLASDASAYMTGANLIVDGGWTAW